VLVNPAGPQTNIPKFYEDSSKAGFDHNDVTVDQVSPLAADMALAMGEYRISGKNQSGAAMEAAGRWTAVDVREGGKLKIRMLTAFPKPPPPQQAAK
jgi:ketosteroid isomerase-like protein